MKVDIPFRPTSIDSLKVCLDSSYSKEIEKVEWGVTIHFEVVGQDANDLTRDRALINITSDKTMQVPIVLPIHETGINTGVYRGWFTVPESTKMLENLTISSAENPSKSVKLMICILVEIGPIEPVRTANEDEEYHIQYSNLGYADDPTWTYSIKCDSLMFDIDTLILSGIPDNEEVGIVSVSFNLSDDVGHFDVQEFNISQQLTRMLKINLS